MIGTVGQNIPSYTDTTAGSTTYYYRVVTLDSLGAAATSAVAPVPPGSNPPTVATPAAASPSVVTGVSTALSVLGADAGGESSLTYTWTVTSLPSGAAAPTYSDNGDNTAQDTAATFYAAGSYTFQVTITDGVGLTTTSSVSATVNQTLTSITVTPASAALSANQTQQFSAERLRPVRQRPDQPAGLHLGGNAGSRIDQRQRAVHGPRHRRVGHDHRHERLDNGQFLRQHHRQRGPDGGHARRGHAGHSDGHDDGPFRPRRR